VTEGESHAIKHSTTQTRIKKVRAWWSWEWSV